LQHFRKQGLDEGWLPLGKLLFHAANSAAMMESSQAHFDMVRPGLMLYGCYPAQRFRRKSALQPVLAWKTQIIQLKKVPARQGLSYGHTFVAPRAMHIGIIPVGYADGYSRLYSNRAKVLVAGRLCPVVGRVCMDLALIDLSKIKSPRLGQEVVLLGKQGSRELDADTLANWRTTIAYEVLCNIGRRVHRKYIR
jgi:alanine racemase